MKRNDRYFFHKLAKRYNNRPEFQDFLVANFVTEDSVNPKWLTGDKAESNYKEWVKIQQSIT
ncbi:uncharacterized protein METZ01_LOCUS456197, partial [marine metagenome]